jgi:hypothetical protein
MQALLEKRNSQEKNKKNAIVWIEQNEKKNKF